MKKKEWIEGLHHIDPDLIEAFVTKKERCAAQANALRRRRRHLLIIAACLALITAALITLPLLWEEEPDILPPSEEQPGIEPSEDATPGAILPHDTRPSIPFTTMQEPSFTPRFFGSEGSDSFGGIQAELAITGLSVTAKLIGVLPDVYTRIDDRNQREFHLLHMQTLKLLDGQEMTEEFYYLVPADFMTDYTVYHCFVIEKMLQLTYDYSVLYNKTQNRAQALDLVIFGHGLGGESRGFAMNSGFMAFDAQGNFDPRLWKSTGRWIGMTRQSSPPATLAQAEDAILNAAWKSRDYVHLLKNVSQEAAQILEQIKSRQLGAYVTTFSSALLAFSPEVQFDATRYIHGFATNEKIRISSQGYRAGESDTYQITKAQFTPEDLQALPDLTSAVLAVDAAYQQGKITPPHIENYRPNAATLYSIIGWYAKTAHGVLGIVRVSWQQGRMSDDAYYVVEYGSQVCHAIDRDDLLRLFGEYETTYIYDGPYDESGKARPNVEV
jgi:hypothetical protein